jgi:hypothetical protein
MPQTNIEATGTIFRQLANAADSGHKDALAEARARSDLRGLYWTAEATLRNSAVFSVCLAKTI